jgi:hypothetical protein
MFGNIAATKSNFSVGNINTFGSFEAPYIHLSYAQTRFHLSALNANRGLGTTKEE